MRNKDGGQAPGDLLLDVELLVAAGSDVDDEELDHLTSHLREELLELDVQSVDRVRVGNAPSDTRAIGAVLVGGILVTLAKSPELLKTIIVVVQSWVAGHPGRSVELQIDGDSLKVTGVSSDQQRQLITMFVERHAGSQG